MACSVKRFGLSAPSLITVVLTVCFFVKNDIFSLLFARFRAVYGGETVMTKHPHYKNYLRSCRKKAGLTQSQLAFLIGRPCRRVCDLEAGRHLPTIAECIAFERLFERPFEEIWPITAMHLEVDATTRVRTLHAQLADANGGSHRKQQRLAYLLRRLSAIVGDIHES